METIRKYSLVILQGSLHVLFAVLVAAIRSCRAVSDTISFSCCEILERLGAETHCRTAFVRHGNGDDPSAYYAVTASYRDPDRKKTLLTFLNHHLAALAAGAREIDENGAQMDPVIHDVHGIGLDALHAAGVDHDSNLLIRLHTAHTRAAGLMFQEGDKEPDPEAPGVHGLNRHDTPLCRN